jgi:hypothetical protein
MYRGELKMDNRLDRGEVIELLEKFGGESDTEILQAARDIHTKISGSNLSWDDLLVPDGDDAAVETTYDNGDLEDDTDTLDASVETTYDNGDLEDDTDTLDTSVGIVATGDATEDTDLIKQLLARKDVSEILREELVGYKEDITEGEFTTADRKYLQALQKRLSGGPNVKS